MVELIEYLRGEWLLSRVIVGIATVEGSAEFRVFATNTLVYEEVGSLTFESGVTANVFRAYYYQFENDEIHVSFVDAAPGVHTFLRLAPKFENGSLCAAGVHVCGSDNYDCRYAFQLPGHFSIDIGVIGPMKKYTMSTQYQRS